MKKKNGVRRMTFNFTAVLAYRELFFLGLKNTILISLTAMIFALIIGTIAAFCRISHLRIPRYLAIFYIEIIRNTPILIQVYFMYFGIGQLIRYKTIFWPSVAILAFFSGSFVAEIIRSGINAVPNGQKDAAFSIGMSSIQVARYVVFPQALRRVLPALAGQLITLIKTSSLVSLLALEDLTYVAQRVSMMTFRVLESYIIVAVFYFIITSTLSQGIGLLERKLARSSKL